MTRRVVFTKDYLQVARYIAENYHITNPYTKLQKIMYFLYLEYLKENNGEKLFSGKWDAWLYGPIHPKLFNHTRTEDFNYGLTWDDLDNDEEAWEEMLGKRDQRQIKRLEDEDKIWFIDNHIGKYLKYDSGSLIDFSQLTKPYIRARADVKFGELVGTEHIIKDEDLLAYAVNEFDWKKMVYEHRWIWEGQV